MTLIKEAHFNLSCEKVIKSIYGFMLILSSIFYEQTFQFAYFTLPLASLCFPLLFLLAAILADKLTFKHCVSFLLSCSIINYLVIMIFCRITDHQINEFWVNNFLTENEIYGLLSFGYHVSIAVSVGLVALWKHFGLRRHFVIIAASACLANFVDLAFMWPTLYTYVDDPYVGSWKLLTIATFKLNFLILCLPFGYLLLRQCNR